MKQAPVNIKNKRATFDYELVDTYTAGIVLTGTEIKSIRMGKASLVDTFCYFANGELWVKNMHISTVRIITIRHAGSANSYLLKKNLINWRVEQKTPVLQWFPFVCLLMKKGLPKW